MASLLAFFDDDADYSKAEMKAVVRQLKRKLDDFDQDGDYTFHITTETGHAAENKEAKPKSDESATPKTKKRKKQNVAALELDDPQSVLVNDNADEESVNSYDSGISSTNSGEHDVITKSKSDTPVMKCPSTDLQNRSKSARRKARRLNSRLERLLSAKERQRAAPSLSSVSRDTDTFSGPTGCTGCVAANKPDGASEKCGPSKQQTEHNNNKREVVPVQFGPPDSSQIVALDCEFVGTGPRKLSALGRCSIVDIHGQVLCDVYARPEEPITDYRTRWSGIRRHHMQGAMSFRKAQDLVRNMIKDKVVVGHAVRNDFHVLGIHHPALHIRDTSRCAALREMARLPCGNGMGLKRLAHILLGRQIQRGQHCSVEDARATMDLYKLVQPEWEKQLLNRSVQDPESPTTSSDQMNSFLDDAYWPDDIVN